MLFVHEIDSIFYKAERLLLEADVIGFDIETAHDFNVCGRVIAEIVQIATEDQVLIFDVPALAQK